nr:hypothetical protein [Pandoravirus massiliensis]
MLFHQHNQDTTKGYASQTDKPEKRSNQMQEPHKLEREEVPHGGGASLQGMPVEILSMICNCTSTPRDLAALAAAALHLVPEPLAVYVGRLIAPDRLSHIVAAGAPLPAVEYLCGHWQKPLAVHMLGDAAAGGRLDVVKWIYSQLTGDDVERHDDEDSCSGDCVASRCRWPSRTSTGMRRHVSRSTYRIHSMHARGICTKDLCSSCTDTGSDTSDTDADDGDHRIARDCRNRDSDSSSSSSSSSSDSDNNRDNASARRNTKTRISDDFAPAARDSFDRRRPAPVLSQMPPTTQAQVAPRNVHIARSCVLESMMSVLMRAVCNGHIDVVRWLVDGPCSADPTGQFTVSSVEYLKIEAASRGNVPILGALCSWRPMRSKNVALAALQADQIDVVEWIASKKRLGKPKMTPAFVGALIAGGHRPRFIQWAASRSYKADPAALVAVVERDDVATVSLLHEAGVCVCTAEVVRAAARAGSLGILGWAAGDDHGTPRVGSAWRPTDVAMLAATNRRRSVIAWLQTRSDGRRALTAGVARAALSSGCVDVAAQIRPLGTWDAVEAAVGSRDPNVVRAVFDAGGVCSPAAFTVALRHGTARVLALLCERSGIAFLESALASLAGVECDPECIEWITANATTSHLCVAEAIATILARDEVKVGTACRCAACANTLP